MTHERLGWGGMALVVALGLGAGAGCSGDDGGGDGPGTTAGADAPTVDAPCSWLDPGDLQAVTGVPFSAGEASGPSCLYRSDAGGAAVSFTIADLDGATPEAAIRAAQASCDADTVTDVAVADGAEGFGCLVGGVTLVVAATEDRFTSLTGATADPEAGGEAIVQDLAALLEQVLQTDAKS